MTANELIATSAETAVAEINKRIEQLAANVSSLRSDVSLRRGKSAFIVYFTGACILALALLTPWLVGFFNIQRVLVSIALYSLCLYLGMYLIPNVILLSRQRKVLSYIIWGSHALDKLNKILSVTKKCQSLLAQGHDLTLRGRFTRNNQDWDKQLVQYQRDIAVFSSEPNLQIYDLMQMGLYWVTSLLLIMGFLMSTTGLLAYTIYKYLHLPAGLRDFFAYIIYFSSAGICFYYFHRYLYKSSRMLGPGTMALSLFAVPAAMMETFLAAALMALILRILGGIWSFFDESWIFLVITVVVLGGIISGVVEFFRSL